MRVKGEPFIAIFEAGSEELWRGRVTSVEQRGRESTITIVEPVTDPPGDPFRATGNRQYVIASGDFDHLLLTAMKDVDE